MTIHRYHVEDIATGRTRVISACTVDQVQRKAWRQFGYAHMPYTSYRVAFRVRVLAAHETHLASSLAAERTAP